MEPNYRDTIDQTMALVQITRDMLGQKRREARMLFIALVVSLIVNVLIVGAFLWYESGWDRSDTTTTTTQTVDGEDNDIVNGDQYNDNSENKSGGTK